MQALPRRLLSNPIFADSKTSFSLSWVRIFADWMQTPVRKAGSLATAAFPAYRVIRLSIYPISAEPRIPQGCGVLRASVRLGIGLLP